MSKENDKGLEYLLELDGQVLVIDPSGKHWVKFVVNRIKPTPEKPHGIDYSITLHDEKGDRLVGFDNAHPIKPTKGPGGKKKQKQDHKHRFKRTMVYDFVSADQLIEDFWAEVKSVLKSRGVKL